MNNLIRDCIFGQIRAVDDATNLQPHEIPKSLDQYITRQECITWDNVTGMNPLYADSKFDNTSHISYGEMIKAVYKLSKLLGLTYVPNMVDDLSVTGYDDLLKKDHKTDAAMVCWTVGYWYQIHLFLNSSDALLYDYTVVRQTNSSYLNVGSLTLAEIFITSKEQVLGKDAISDIPIMYSSSWKSDNYPILALTHSFYHIFDKAAVKQLQCNLLINVLKEMEIYYKRLGKNAKQIGGKSGTLMHNVAIKNDIIILDIEEDTLIHLPMNRSPRCADWGRVERNQKTF